MVRRVPTTRLNSITPSARPHGPPGGPRLPWLPGEDRHDCGGRVVAEEPTAVLGEGGPGLRHLPVAAPAAKLVDELDELAASGRADRMPLRQQASAGVHRH